MLHFSKRIGCGLESRAISVVLGLACVGIVVFGFWFVGFGFDVNDEAYQTMNAMAPRINPQAVLSSSLSNLFGKMFGFSFYSMRVLTFTLTLISIGSAVVYFYHRKLGSANLSMLVFLALIAASFCMPVKSRLIGWDCYAVLFTTLSLIVIMRIWDGCGLRSVILLGLTAACATLSRFPDVVIVPVSVFAMFACRNQDLRRRVWMSVAFLGAFALFMIIILCVIYDGDPLQWVRDLQANFVSGHSLGRLMANYIHTGKFDLIDCCLLSFTVLIATWLTKGRARYNAILSVSLFAVVLCVLILKIDRVYYPVTRLLTSCVIIMMAVYAVCANGRKVQTIIQALVVLGCCITPMAGSDGGTFKFMNLSTIPLALLMLASIDRAVVVSVVRNMTYSIMLACAVVMPLYTARHTVFDGGWSDAIYPVDHHMLKGNTTNQARSKDINDMLDEGRKVLPHNVMIIGDNNRRFFSEYIWNSRNTLWPHAWNGNILNDECKVELLKNAIESDMVGDIAFAKYGAENVDYNSNLMRKFIEETGKYKSEEHEWFVIFRRNK